MIKTANLNRTSNVHDQHDHDNDGKNGDHVIVAPPYIAQASDIDAIVARLGDAVDAAVASV